MASSTGKRPVYGPSVSDLSNSTDRSMGNGGGGGGFGRFLNTGSPVSLGRVSSPVGGVYGVRGIPLGGGSRLDLGVSPRRGGSVGGSLSVPFKKGGEAKKMAKGGSTASKRADGCAVKGKTKGRMV